MARLSKLACPASANGGSLSSFPVPPAPMMTGRLQQTLADCVERQGKALHSGKVSTVRLCPERASRGRRVPNSNVEEVGLTVATDLDGKSVEKMAPHVNEPVCVYTPLLSSLLKFPPFLSLWFPVNLRWPYPFLELNNKWAPIWYLCLAVIHAPCYGVYYLIVRAKIRFSPDCSLKHFCHRKFQTMKESSDYEAC
ncbi:hypothetical protein D0Y65_031812 [Glycine soja]|uniref:Uncharacterized protein n=1 Tax=Glycine soja TaxID=3848 RepID=A0A445IA34_GLYSO|nr:hypothetical protein D0Y65_031812 [Glycine soja]RZB82897.1 hypothetical protein D0Y65_031812 [Glycine soja]